MKTLVVNLKNSPYFDVYCGRASSCPKGFTGPGFDGIFGNPFVVLDHSAFDTRPDPDAAKVIFKFSSPGPIGYAIAVGSRADAIEAFESYFLDRISANADFAAKVLGLRGRVLGCWCAPLPCHVSEVIVPWLEEHCT